VTKKLYFVKEAKALLNWLIISRISLALQFPTEIRYQQESLSAPNALKGTTAKLAWLSKKEVI
jgi:hypothetical protein